MPGSLLQICCLIFSYIVTLESFLMGQMDVRGGSFISEVAGALKYVDWLEHRDVLHAYVYTLGESRRI